MVEQQNTTDLTEIYVIGDQPKPATNPNYPRLYGHHLCPFVEKARLALGARGIKYQKCEMDLHVKAPWHVAINGGFVPILELPDGTILHESKVLMDFAEEAYPESGYSTLPSDPVQRAQIRLAIALIDQTQSVYYPIYMKRLGFSDEDAKNLKDKLQKIEDFLAVHQKESGFAFGTENPTQLDIHFFPLLGRLDSLKGSALDTIGQKVDLDGNFPRIKKLIEAVRARPEFREAVCQKIPQHHAFEDLLKLADGERPYLKLPVRFE